MIDRDAFTQGQKLQLDAATEAWVAADLADGYIAGTASTPSVDLAGHQVLVGAFDESIAKRGLNKGPGVKLLLFHSSQKPAGVINKLVTVQDQLKISAQLNLELGYVSDAYKMAKMLGGLSFSVGFSLEEFKFAKHEKFGEILVVEKGDLMEVSVVTFPAQPEATMDFVKDNIEGVNTPSEFEKALIKNGFVLNRNQAHKLMQFCRSSVHLFDPPMQVSAKTTPAHPVLDACQLKAASDQIERVKELLAAR
jgi:HK97 family phage prohead protease